MVNERNALLTSAEIGNLWLSYMHNDVVSCMLKHSVPITQDPQIRTVSEFALNFIQKQNQEIEKYYTAEGIGIPKGYKEFNAGAPRLFADTFVLYYLQQLSKVTLQFDGTAYSMASRKDMRDFFKNSIDNYIALNEKTVSLQLANGQYIRSPHITVANAPVFVNGSNFLGNLLGMEERPLTAIEIAHLFTNALMITVAKSLVTGFSQVANSPEIREFFVREKNLASKHIEIFTKLIRESDVSAPMQWDADITHSTSSPFTDKMMLFHIQILSSAALANYGVAVSTSLRKDLTVTYSKCAAEIMDCMKDGVEIMIKHGWVEEPPQAINREALALSR